MGNLCLAKSAGPSSDWAEHSWEPCNVSAWEGGGAEVSAGKGGGITSEALCPQCSGWPASPRLLWCQLQNVYTQWNTSPWRMAESSVAFPTGKHVYTHVFLHGFHVFLIPLEYLKPKFKIPGLNQTKKGREAHLGLCGEGLGMCEETGSALATHHVTLGKASCHQPQCTQVESGSWSQPFLELFRAGWGPDTSEGPGLAEGEGGTLVSSCPAFLDRLLPLGSVGSLL